MSTYGTGTLGHARGYDGAVLSPWPHDRQWGQYNYGDAWWGTGSLQDATLWLVEIEVAGVWVDVTCDVRAITVHRGRSRQLDSFVANTASVLFANFDDRYSAWNPYGVWAGNGVFRTDVPIRVHSVGFPAGRTEWLFTGTTDAVIDSWPGTTDALTEVQATDVFKSFARLRIPLAAAVGAGELSGARVARILDAAQYEGARALDAGQAPLQATTFDDVALDMLDEVRESEWGALYVRADGTVTFRDRAARDHDPRMSTVQWTFVDDDADLIDSTCVCYSELTLTANDEGVVNSANVTRDGSTNVQHYEDATSIEWYKPRTWSRDDLPLANDVDALALAQLVVTDHAYNERRVESIVFYPLFVDNGPAVATGVRMLDRVRVLRHMPGGTVLDAQLLVQGVTHELVGGGDARQAGSWKVTLATTNAAVVGDAGAWDAALWDDDVWGA